LTQRSSKWRVALAALALAIVPVVARAGDTSVARSYIGLQGLAIVGEHRDIAGTQHGIGAGPLVEVRVGTRRIALAVEGIPVVSVPGTKPSAHYGQATPALGIFNGQFEYALDASRRTWVGLGETIYNQRTPLPNLDQRVASRLAGVRYTARYRAPLTGTRFVEALVGVTPALFGSDRYEYSDGVTPPVDKEERASEVDASIAIGWDRNASEWLLGLRTLNFTARFVKAGDAADRNVGLGVMLEWRHLIRRS
jgi:hypothetical protein